jgi:hypothetical protein
MCDLNILDKRMGTPVLPFQNWGMTSTLVDPEPHEVQQVYISATNNVVITTIVVE